LQADISGKTTFRLQLLQDKHTEAQIAAADKDIEKLLQRYQILQHRIQASSPAYAALTIPQPLTVEEARKLLDADTLLLEYSLGEERSYAFLVSQNGLQTYDLPSRGKIEQAARAYYEKLTPRNPRRRPLAGRRAALALTRASSNLSRMILGPLRGKLGTKRLLIVSDGALQYVPFAALADPASPKPVPLMMAHEIVNLPSASVLAILRQQDSNRQPAGKMIAVLADPVFSTEDSRLRSSSKLAAHPRQTRSAPPDGFHPAGSHRDERLTRSVRDIGLTRLSRLRYTRLEAASITSLAPKSQTLQALDFDASRATALNERLSDYRIIHFATHGLLDSAHPELSGLVLSLVDKNGKPLNGFLSLEDVYNMNLSADLVVLSACETGLGKEISGEGMIGLTRGFMYAGATRVLASLWRVSDVGTERLMKHFYTLMLRDHWPPAAALRKAQIAMWKEPRWSSPYYWAAFELQGELKYMMARLHWPSASLAACRIP
jgi:CHAT domain-containing protein